MPRFTLPFHDCPILAPGHRPTHLPPERIIAMPWTLAFAPTAEDLEEDFFGLPVATFASPQTPAEHAARRDEDDEARPAD
jgi:hypothetical protein